MLDIAIVGGGPAGLSAAITAGQRGNSASIISNDSAKSGLFKAPEVGNYPGFPKISGPDLLRRLIDHALDSGASLITDRVHTILPTKGAFQVGYGSDIIAAKSVILATGIVQSALFPGEEKLLGNGVSYCATCDGMLFRGKKVCAICLSHEAEEEASYLESIGCEVVRLRTKDIRISGEKQLSSVIADGEEIKCAGVFIFRQTVAPHLLLPNLETIDGHIRAGASAETNIAGVFAAGDCVGKPYQIAKAIGQGQIAALHASEYVIGS